jgi:diaminopimelate epimerase
MRIFNSDGSEPAMCGNGMRCLIAFLRKLGWEGSTCSIQTGAGILLCQIDGSKTSIHLGAPRVLFKDFSLLANHWKMDVVDTGVPHGVIFVEDIDLPHLIDAARPIRFDSQFSPDGINVNFAEVLPDRSIAVRTYERGVEGETMSCGTGSSAVAWLAAEQFSLSYPITIRNNKRVAQLEVCYSKQYGIGLKGEATHVFEGFFNLDSNDLRSGA